LRYLLFIPVYNCEKQITRVLESIRINKVDENFLEIIVVDNRSTDLTIEAVKSYTENNDLKVTILQNKENYNLGGSHKVAFKYMIENNYDFIMVLHGDDQANVEDIQQFIDISVFNRYDKIMGSRFMKKSKIEGYSLLRKYGNVLMNIFTSVMTNHLIKDLGSGLNMYSSNFVKSDFFNDCSDNLTFNNHLIFCDPEMKERFIYLPIQWKEEDQISNAKLIKQAIEIIGLSIRKSVISLKNRKKKHRKLCLHSTHEYIKIGDN